MLGRTPRRSRASLGKNRRRKVAPLEPGRDAEFRRATALEGTGFEDAALDRIGQGQDRVNQRHDRFLEMGAAHVARDRREATGMVYPFQYR